MTGDGENLGVWIKMPDHGRPSRSAGVLVAACLALLPAAGAAAGGHAAEGQDDAPGESASRFSDQPVPLKIEGFPRRPRPILELGEPFLGTGTLDGGFEMPGGGVWQPSLLLYGTYRTALQTFESGRSGTERQTDWANRLDLFGNLQLTGTERVLIGFRPLDQNGRFSGFVLEPGGREDGSENDFNFRITRLFFEGDLGEILPELDPTDAGTLDWGFAVGRMPLIFQEGLLIDDDAVDAVALVRDSLFPDGGSDLKLTFLVGWNNLHRNDNEEQDGPLLFGLFTESDWPVSSVQADFAYIRADRNDGGDGVFWGLGAVQRLGAVNTAFRIVGSAALDRESAKVSSGHLLFAEASWTPPHTHDNLYVNGFWAIDEFTSALRGPDAGGPLGRTGLVFAAVGLGRFGAPLGNRAENALGTAVGYQMFFDETRKQLILELGARTSTRSADNRRFAVSGRYAQAIGEQMILRLDAFTSFAEEEDAGFGGRVELQFKF